MRRNAFQLSRRHKLALYAATFVVLASGIAWWVLDRYASVEDEFGGIMKHPAQPWMLKLHGAGAMAFLIVLGTLLPIHVKRSWQARQNRPTGVLLLVFFGVLTVSGYGLYYFAGEKLRGWTSDIHWWLGLASPVILAAHVIRGHWLRRHGRLRIHTTAESAPE